MDEAKESGLNFYVDDEGREQGVCWLDLQGGLSPEVEVFPTGLSPIEVELVEALLATNPDHIRTLLNHISESSYALGLKHGRQEEGILSTSLSFEKDAMPNPGVFAQLATKLRQQKQGGEPTETVASRLDQLQAIEDDILKHEPGSGSEFLDLPGSRPVDSEDQSFATGIQEAIGRIDAMPIVPILKLSK